MAKTAAWREKTDEIIALRKQRISCREVASRLGVPESAVYQVMRENGMAHRYRARCSRYRAYVPAAGPLRPDQRLAIALAQHDAVTVEHAAGGGYIVTLDDLHAGLACPSVEAAIRSALRAAGSAGADRSLAGLTLDWQQLKEIVDRLAEISALTVQLGDPFGFRLEQIDAKAREARAFLHLAAEGNRS